MGKCSGLKGGGHHRRALDVAAKKQSEKAARKKEQAEAGKRALILKEILTKIDKDCDLYLDAAVCERFQPSHNGNAAAAAPAAAAAAAAPAAAAAANPELCRKHFRHEACTNKRCRFSKEYSIAEALSNVMSGINTNTAFDNYNNKSNKKNNNGHNNDDGDNDNVKNTMTIPALRYLPGILGDHHGGSKAKKNRRILRRRRPDDDAVGDHLHPQTPPPPPPPLLFSLFETALSEGSSAVDRIVSCLDEDRDVVSFGSACWHLYDQILRDQGCPGVQLRRYRSNHRKLDRRNETLLSNKALGGSLRYAVGYFESTTFHNNSKQKSKKKNNNNSSSSSNNNNKPRLRPVLIFDYENPNVYKAFVESGVRKTYRHLGAGGDGGDAGLELESALDKNCKLSG